MSKQFNKYLLKICKSIISITLDNKNISIYIPLSKLMCILTIFKYHTNFQFKILTDICTIDYPNRVNRFSLNYNLLSIKYNCRLQIKILTNELDVVPSISNLYTVANWYEREIWDMFGIYFSNHPDLRRLLSDYGFEGHPLRKDFPLTGFLEVRYSELEKRVVYEKISISQESKSFRFHTPW